MESPRKFKGSMFGYKKKDVSAYILESAKKFEDAKTELAAENEKLQVANDELQAANNELKAANDNFAAQKCSLEDKIATLEKERTYIADALLNAKQEAEKMLCEARVEAAQTRSALELELEELKAQIRSEKARIDEIRNDAKSALNAYIDRLDNIDMESEPSSDEYETDDHDDEPDYVDEIDEPDEEEDVGDNDEDEYIDEDEDDDDEDDEDDDEDDDDEDGIYIPGGDDDFDFGIEDIES